MRATFPNNIMDAPTETQYKMAEKWRDFLSTITRDSKVTVDGKPFNGAELLWGRVVQEDFDWELSHQDDGYTARCDREGFVGDPNWDS